MNIEKLREAEGLFMSRYPEGFSDPEMLEVAKKHRMEKMTEFAAASFGKESFGDPVGVAEDMSRLAARSSMVSVFEKARFRDHVKAMGSGGKRDMAGYLYDILHGDQERGFNGLVNMLAPEKLAKWTLVTVFGAYYRPDFEVFVKPTTTKNVIKYLEIEDIAYKPLPSYDFYIKYREYVNSMKKEVDPSLSPSNAAFLGFLMMCI